MVTSSDIITCGSTLLNWFVQLNWTGPKDNVPAPPQTTQEQLVCMEYVVFVNFNYLLLKVKWNSWCMQEMSHDGEV